MTDDKKKTPLSQRCFFTGNVSECQALELEVNAFMWWTRATLTDPDIAHGSLVQHVSIKIQSSQILLKSSTTHRQSPLRQ